MATSGKRGTKKAAAGEADAADDQKPGTLAWLADAFLEALQKDGRSAGTARSYLADLRVAMKHFGAKTQIASLTPRKVENFFSSDAVTKTRDGGEKNPITVAKIRRVLRMALYWAVDAGHLETAPLPEAKS